MRNKAKRAIGSTLAAAVACICACALAPASASAVATHPVLGFSPITGSGTGVTLHYPSGVGVDDAPVSRAIVDMKGGKKGLIVNSTDLCQAKHHAKANITGQNGKRYEARPLVRPQCGKRHGKRKRSHRRGRHGGAGR